MGFDKAFEHGVAALHCPAGFRRNRLVDGLLATERLTPACVVGPVAKANAAEELFANRIAAAMLPLPWHAPSAQVIGIGPACISGKTVPAKLTAAVVVDVVDVVDELLELLELLELELELELDVVLLVVLDAGTVVVVAIVVVVVVDVVVEPQPGSLGF